MPMKNIVNKNILPRGFGKSLPHQLLIPIREAVGQFHGKKVIASSSLIALIMDQFERVSLIPGGKTVYLGKKRYLFNVKFKRHCILTYNMYNLI